MAYVLENVLDLYTRTELLMEHHNTGFKQEQQQYDASNYVQFTGRYFSDITPKVVEIITPIINNELGQGTWKIDNANFFDTKVPYRVHTDTGLPDPNPWKTFVFPLKVFAGTEYNPAKNALYVLNQRWYGPAAFFVKGSTDVKEEYNKVITDYSDVAELTHGFDEQLVEECSHLPRNNFEGLSVQKRFEWRPGNVIVFDRRCLHVSTNFLQAGARRKIGLSVFTSCKD